MKIILRILVVLIGLYVLLVVSLLVYSYFQKRSVPEMTPEKAQKLFETVGGINEVNREAKTLLNQPRMNDWTFLDPQDLTNSPAISSLFSLCENYSGEDYSGTSVAISPDSGRHIEIKFGNHFSLKWLYIFDPSTNVTFSPPSNWFQITSNILLQNESAKSTNRPRSPSCSAAVFLICRTALTHFSQDCLCAKFLLLNRRVRTQPVAPHPGLQ